jgi:hypothetical protein
MTREEVMEMAYESGMIAGYEGEPDLLERFAALVAAAERDRCCGLIFSWAGSDNVAQRTVDAIRGNGCLQQAESTSTLP